ncbi:uncharacterized protein LOC131065778 [Cryptomeria japonica]|uniref:uncharacterized protein LOC131065778 n=1 Tax=Cryptomeria japonica TaxID=3369 RepID=UPI0027DA4FC6|nr:uncharacterized protein LOC131065778 [Cryptomeria japonica]
MAQSQKKCVIWKYMYNILPSLIIWETWKERNHRIFQDKEMPQIALCGKIEKSLIELMNEASKQKNLKHNILTKWDVKLMTSLPNLIIPTLFGNGNQQAASNPRLNVKWELPEEGWSKINFDGAFAVNPGRSGIGCIVRDAQGICIKEIAEDIGLATNNEAEFRAALRGLLLGVELGIKKIHLEGDSLKVINAIRQKSTPSWNLNQWLQTILAVLDKVEDFRISHVFIEENTEADRLSKSASCIDDDIPAM